MIWMKCQVQFLISTKKYIVHFWSANFTQGTVKINEQGMKILLFVKQDFRTCENFVIETPY